MDSVNPNQTNRNPNTCLHETFESNVTVNRLTKAGGGPVTGYSADVSIRCLQCHHDFYFVGMPMGCAPDFACVSADGKEARIPISPTIREELTFSIERAPRPNG